MRLRSQVERLSTSKYSFNFFKCDPKCGEKVEKIVKKTASPYCFVEVLERAQTDRTSKNRTLQKTGFILQKIVLEDCL